MYILKSINKIQQITNKILKNHHEYKIVDIELQNEFYHYLNDNSKEIKYINKEINPKNIWANIHSQNKLHDKINIKKIREEGFSEKEQQEGYSSEQCRGIYLEEAELLITMHKNHSFGIAKYNNLEIKLKNLTVKEIKQNGKEYITGIKVFSKEHSELLKELILEFLEIKGITINYFCNLQIIKGYEHKQKLEVLLIINLLNLLNKDTDKKRKLYFQFNFNNIKKLEKISKEIILNVKLNKDYNIVIQNDFFHHLIDNVTIDEYINKIIKPTSIWANLHNKDKLNNKENILKIKEKGFLEKELLKGGHCYGLYFEEAKLLITLVRNHSFGIAIIENKEIILKNLIDMNKISDTIEYNAGITVVNKSYFKKFIKTIKKFLKIEYKIQYCDFYLFQIIYEEPKNKLEIQLIIILLNILRNEELKKITKIITFSK